MAKKTKLWLITALSLLLIGSILICGVMASLGWDFAKLSTDRFETNRHQFSTLYKNIVIVTDTADVVFLPSEDGRIAVECYEETDARHLVTGDGETLTIRLEDRREWYHRIGIRFGEPRITVFLPRAVYGNLTLDTNAGDVTIPADFQFYNMDITGSTGDVTVLASAGGDMNITLSTGEICLKRLSANSIALTTSTGDIEMESITCRGDLSITVASGDTELEGVGCKTFLSTGDTGELSVEGVTAEESFSIVRTTGDVALENCDAPEIIIETDTGNVSGSLLSPKLFIVETDTGHIRVPRDTPFSGTCTVTTDTGDILFRIIG